MENNKETQPQLRKYLQQKAAAKKIPISGTFELTPRCNMNCRMCYIRMSEEEMKQRGREYTTEEWVEMGRICREQGMLFLLLTGGEPFLRPDFKEIYTSLNQMGFIISINSNGTLINEETVEWLKEYPPSKINITVYGSSNDTYNNLCGNPNGFEQTKKAIDLLIDAGIAVNINLTMTPDNFYDIEEIHAFADERGIPVNSTAYMFPPVRSAKEGVTDESARFTPHQAGEALFRSKKCTLGEKRMIQFSNTIRSGIFEQEDEDDECTRVPDEHMGCLAGRASFWITWDGRMTPCGMMNEPVCRPFEEGFMNGWKKICEETAKIYLPPECTQCKKRTTCMICGALTIAECNGDSTKKPEYLCKITDEYMKMCAEYGDKLEKGEDYER